MAVAIQAQNASRPCDRRNSTSSMMPLTKQTIRLDTLTSSRERLATKLARSMSKLIHTSSTTRCQPMPNAMTHSLPSHSNVLVDRRSPISKLQRRPNRQSRPSHRQSPRLLMLPSMASQQAIRSRTGIPRSHRSCCSAASSTPTLSANGSMTGPCTTMERQPRCLR